VLAQLKTPPPARDWYYTASPEARQEYDAFGPWVRTIGSQDEMPPRFRAAWPEISGAHFVFKLPIRAERRDVRPGMDLYAMVMAVGDDGVTVLRLTGEKIDRRSFTWDEVIGISSFTDLLDGRWSLLLSDGSRLEASYNTVSAHHFAALGDFIRQKLAPGETPNAPSSVAASAPIKDLFYRNQARTVRTGSGGAALVLHFEPRDRLCRDDANRRRLSTGLLVLDAGDALVIVDRGTSARGLFHPSYAARQVFLPYRRLTGFTFTPAQPGGRRFAHLVISADRQTLPLACLDRPDSVIAHLTARGVSSG